MSPSEASGLLAAAEMGHSVDKEEYEKRLADLRVELLNHQFDCRSSDFSVILLIAGDDRPGCIDLLHSLHEWMDARYMETHVLYGDTSEEEQERPVFWQYWRRLPPAGRIGIFLGAWPVHAIRVGVEDELGDLELDGVVDHLERIERELAQAGTLVLKFWLHVPQDVLSKRRAKAKKNPERHWRVGERDWEILDAYDETMAIAERVLRGTNTPSAPWNVVESTDRRHRNLAVARQISHALAGRLASGPPEPQAAAVAMAPPAEGEKLVLDRVDLSASLDPKDYERELEELQRRLHEISRAACDRGTSCVMAFEGWDAAGKGGAIRRIIRAMPVQSVRVVPIAAPTEEERARHYLWRFWRHIPRDGNTVIFDRSWYGRVLVERVEGFAKEHEWRRAYGEITDFESQLHEHGIALLKFWLHIDAEEQLRRFQARAKTAYKKYKLTEEDFRNREKWPDYARAVHDMVSNTDTSYAPWHLVAANDKRQARIEVLRAVCDRLAASLEEKRVQRPRGKKNPKKDRKGKKS